MSITMINNNKMSHGTTLAGAGVKQVNQDISIQIINTRDAITQLGASFLEAVSHFVQPSAPAAPLGL